MVRSSAWIATAVAAASVVSPALGQTISPAPTPTAPASADSLTPLQRATVFVRDQRKSLALYRDLLGMHVYFDHYWDNDGINTIMATRRETLRAVVLEGVGDPVYGKLGIYQLSAAAVAKAPPPSRATTTLVGDFALVFRTGNLDATYAKLRAGGYPIVSPPTVLRFDPTKRVQQREMMFRDPDGVLVNLIQPAVPAS